LQQPPIAIREAAPEEAALCEEILRSLPGWFGIEEAIVSYRADIEAMETLVAVRENRIVGFLTLKAHNPRSAEIQVMALRREEHGKGIGGALVGHAEALLIARGSEYLEVKTLGPSRPNDDYARTRGFYAAVGFVPLEENELWGEGNPCLIMIKHLRCARDS
jgi:GNAT superfamily N-acetyltransferase